MPRLTTRLSGARRAREWPSRVGSSDVAIGGASETATTMTREGYPEATSLLAHVGAEALSLSGYPALRGEQRLAREAGRCFGIGISCFVEDMAKGSVYDAARGRPVMPRADGVRVRVEPTGRVTVVAAEELGVPLERVTVRHSDTDLGVSGRGGGRGRGDARRAVGR